MSAARKLSKSSLVFSVFALQLIFCGKCYPQGLAQYSDPTLMRMYAEIQRTVKQEYMTKLGYSESVAALSQTEKQIREGRPKLLEMVKGQNYYLMAAEAAAKASEELEKLRQSSEKLDSEKVKELSAKIRAPAEIIRRDVDEEPGLVQLHTVAAQLRLRIRQIPTEADRLMQMDNKIGRAHV